MDINPYEAPRETGFRSPTPLAKTDWVGAALCLTLAFGFWGVVLFVMWLLVRMEILW